MSGVATIGGGEATSGLKPRYLRRVDAPEISAEIEAAVKVAQASKLDELPELPGMRGTSLTEELRKRIASVAPQEKRRTRPIWVGVAVVVLVAAVGLMFPDAFLGLMPSASASL